MTNASKSRREWGWGPASTKKSATVIDFAQFRAEREQKQLSLFDGEAPGRTRVLEPRRDLSSREVEHRQRMLRHLGE